SKVTSRAYELVSFTHGNAPVSSDCVPLTRPRRTTERSDATGGRTRHSVGPCDLLQDPARLEPRSGYPALSPPPTHPGLSPPPEPPETTWTSTAPGRSWCQVHPRRHRPERCGMSFVTGRTAMTWRWACRSTKGRRGRG